MLCEKEVNHSSFSLLLLSWHIASQLWEYNKVLRILCICIFCNNMYKIKVTNYILLY